MAKVYSNGVTLPTGFKREFPAPGFEDEIWEFVDDLDTIPNQFVGMEVFIVENETKYILKSDGWKGEPSSLEELRELNNVVKGRIIGESVFTSKTNEDFAQIKDINDAIATIDLTAYSTTAQSDVKYLQESNYKEVNSNYTLLQSDSGKTILVNGNNRVITVPTGLTGKFHITVKVRGTGATLIDDDGLLVGKPTELTSPYSVPQFGLLYFLRDDSGNIDLTEVIVAEEFNELQEQLEALVNLTNDDNTLIIDGSIIRTNVTNITEEFIANGVDRNFEMINVYASIENVFINGVRIKSSDYITISEQEIEIKTIVTLLLGDEVVIQGTMFVVE